MRRRDVRPVQLAALLVVLVAGAASVASAQDQEGELSPKQVMDRIQEFYKSTYDYQAGFDQIYVDVAAGETKKSHGRVFLKKPGKMRWDYLGTKDDKTALSKVMVSNGTAFTIYEPEFNQYFRKCLKDSQLPTALSFLMGKGDMGKEFNPKLIKAEKDGTYMVEMIPKKSSGKYKKLVFIVSKETFAVEEAHVYDPYGNLNKLIFSAPLINKKLPDSGFDFTPPDGARNIGGNVTCN